MSDERGDEKGKRARRTMTQEDMETSRLEAVECRRPLAATRQEQPEAKDKTRHITTCSRKFDMKPTSPSISESSFMLPADGWIHIEMKEFIPTRRPASCQSLTAKLPAHRQSFAAAGLPAKGLATAGFQSSCWPTPGPTCIIIFSHEDFSLL